MNARELFWHASIVPLLLLLAIAAEYSGFDLALTRHFFDAETQSWPYKNLYLTTKILHDSGRNAMVLVAVANLILIGLSYRVASLRSWRPLLAFSFVAGLLGPAIVGALKGITHISTPWDLMNFGGHRPYLKVFDPVPEGLGVGHAFPGGHSSGGFAYLSLYFAMAFNGIRGKRIVLAMVLLIGGAFAATQEIRGAHFPSHDLASLAICWGLSLGLACVWFRKQPLPLFDYLNREPAR